MEGAILRTLFTFSLTSLGLNLTDITEDQALARPAGGGNCINWIAGHILCYRDAIHEFLGLPPAWPAGLAAKRLYDRGTDGEVGEGGLTLSAIRAALDASQALVLPALEALSRERLGEQATKTQTVGQRLAFAGFHEGYHSGQVGALRRIFGLPGAIA